MGCGKLALLSQMQYTKGECQSKVNLYSVPGIAGKIIMKNFRFTTKLVYLSVSLIATFLVFIFNRNYQITYSVSHQETLSLRKKEIEDIIIMIKTDKNNFGKKYNFKTIDNHPGYNNSLKNYKMINFGYCSFSQCLILSNEFRRNEFTLILYKNRIFPFFYDKHLFNKINSKYG